jgi:hypothetical protein
MNAGNAAVKARRAAMTRANALYQQIYNSIKR